MPPLNIGKKEKSSKPKSPRKNMRKLETMLKSNIDEHHYNEIIAGEIHSSRNNMLTPPRDVSPNIKRQDKMFTDED